MMEKRRRVKNWKKKNEETRAPWADLPQEILGIILGKLLSTVDVIRFRAVCKSWHIKDIPKDHRNLPWLCNLSWSKDKPDFVECEMYDPYSRRIFKTSKFVESRRYNRSFSNDITCLASNQGWLVAAFPKRVYDWEIFMYNPYSQHFISLPFIRDYQLHLATFSGNPVSSNDCRVFLILSRSVRLRAHSHYYIASYGLNNGDKEWEIKSFDIGVNGFFNQQCRGMQYMNEQLFFLLQNGKMIRYTLADKSQTSIYLGKGSHRLGTDYQPLWLAKGDGDLLVACELDFDRRECWTFYFDWPSMRWVRSDLKESSAVFISGDIATSVRPFEDKDDVENNKGCKVYFFERERRRKGPSDYSFAKMRTRWKHSPSTVFMESPRIN